MAHVKTVFANLIAYPVHSVFQVISEGIHPFQIRDKNINLLPLLTQAVEKSSLSCTEGGDFFGWCWVFLVYVVFLFGFWVCFCFF